KRRLDPCTIAIVARRGDAQLGELNHYARRFAVLGQRAYVVTPEQVRLEQGAVKVEGQPAPDLIYRHVFARRLESDSDFARICPSPERYRVLNPIASHLEVKGMLALLSAAVTPAGAEQARQIGLTDDEQSAVERVLPWTRLLQAGPTVGPDGSPASDLIDF